MKKIVKIFIVILILIIAITVFMACSKKSETRDSKNGNNAKIVVSDNFDNISSLLTKYPDDITSDDAVNKGFFVIGKDDNYGQENWDLFYKNIQDGKNSSIIIQQYNEKGDMLLEYVSYIDNQFYFLEDDSRDSVGTENDVIKATYKYLKTFNDDQKGKRFSIYCLLNDDTITSESYFKSLISSDSKDIIKSQILFFKE